MASGSVIRYQGKRGTVWRIKYRDASGAQVMETIGAEREGITEKKARELLQERQVDVRRKAYRRPRALTFKAYRGTWFEQGTTRRRWTNRTEIQYRSILKRLGEFFDPFPLGGIRPRHIAEYVAEQAESYQASTVSRDLSILHDLFATAMREELIESNPAAGAEHPKKAKRRWRILNRPRSRVFARRSPTSRRGRSF